MKREKVEEKNWMDQNIYYIDTISTSNIQHNIKHTSPVYFSMHSFE